MRKYGEKKNTNNNKKNLQRLKRKKKKRKIRELLSSAYGSLKIRNRTPLESSRREKKKGKKNLFGSAYGSLEIWDRTPLLTICNGCNYPSAAVTICKVRSSPLPSSVRSRSTPQVSPPVARDLPLVPLANGLSYLWQPCNSVSHTTDTNSGKSYTVTIILGQCPVNMPP